MHDWIGWIPLLGAFARGWSVPGIFAVLAIIHVLRTGASKWWIPVLIFLPMIGALAYFVAGAGAWRAPVEDARRARVRGAKARLARLETQLSHWRGPALLAESAEELLTLGRLPEAEARFREARAAGAPLEDVDLGFSETVIALKRPAEAVPVLRELLAVQPDFRLGAAQLLLARCLDEMGKAAEAEEALRACLARRTLPEARARLARLLVLRGARDEGQELARAVYADYDTTPPKLRRSHATWARLARRVLRGDTRLPRAATLNPGRPWGWIAGLVLLGAAAVVWLVLRFV